MPAVFEITSEAGVYPVIVKQGDIARLLQAHPNAHVIIDARLVQQTPLGKEHNVLTIEATEDNKEYEAIADYIKHLREHKLTRKSVLVAIGGGVIQDISGFIASIYMRGVDWHYAPTTLLGMVDSCIGGKSSINVKGTKNLVGTFYPPLSVVIDPDYIKTLLPAQIIDGLCEAAKICFAHPDTKIFESYLALGCEKPGAKTDYETLIGMTLKAKKWFIEIDEFDQKERLLLNFGHTFGHAIEVAGDYAISHGIAVGLGMLCAIAFSESAATHPRTVQLKNHVTALLASLPELGSHVRVLDVKRIMKAFQSDKKHSAEEYVVIVPDKNGMLGRERIARNAQYDTSLGEAILTVIGTYGKI